MAKVSVRKKVAVSFAYAVMTPIGFLSGYFFAAGQIPLSVLLVGMNTVLECVAVFWFIEAVGGE